MGNESMGRVLTEATIYNLGDLIEVERGKLGAREVRKVVVTDALVDTRVPTRVVPKKTRLARELSNSLQSW
ncbi:MAG TPA: hypothetical protein VGI99_11590 [Gemmataceae bacterium]